MKLYYHTKRSRHLKNLCDHICELLKDCNKAKSYKMEIHDGVFAYLLLNNKHLVKGTLNEMKYSGMKKKLKKYLLLMLHLFRMVSNLKESKTSQHFIISKNLLLGMNMIMCIIRLEVVMYQEVAEEEVTNWKFQI